MQDFLTFLANFNRNDYVRSIINCISKTVKLELDLRKIEIYNSSNKNNDNDASFSGYRLSDRGWWHEHPQVAEG